MLTRQSAAKQVSYADATTTVDLFDRFGLAELVILDGMQGQCLRLRLDRLPIQIHTNVSLNIDLFS